MSVVEKGIIMSKHLTKIPSLMNSTSLRVSLSKEQEQEQEQGQTLSAVMTLATGSVQTDAVRTEALNGRDYTVVPVVAIIEGVLHGANAANPEFAPASEFGKFPKAWDGRPVVMNHPQLNGIFVSAAIPEVLEEFGMGMLFNTKLEDTKLKTEAWLDHERIEELGGELLTTLERIKGGEVVEVSVGAWLDVNPGRGIHNGKAYMGTWTNVAPDHLAFLSEGVQGACSVEDGCGVPRLFRANHASIGQNIEEPKSGAACCDKCAASGGSCSAPLEGAAAAILANERRGNAFKELLVDLDFGDSNFSVNAIPNNLAFDDIARLLEQAVMDALNVPYYDFIIYAITADAVVYKEYGKPGMLQRTYTVSSEGAVSLAGEVTPVNLLTRIVPRQVNSPNVSERNEVMPGSETGQGADSTNTTTNVETGAAGTTVPAAESNVATAETASPTFEALLKAAPQEQREAFEHGQRMFKARKDELVKGISANERNSFSVEQLNAFDIATLENLAKLGSVATFEGRAPAPAGQEGIDTSTKGRGPSVSSATKNYLTGDSKAA
jgi:hypothetical protein